MIEEELTERIIGAAIEVHRHLGPGLLESTYRECLCHELESIGLKVVQELRLPIVYKKIRLDHGYRMDLLIEDKVVVELKTVDTLSDVHFAQTLTYLRLGNYRVGLLINFNVKMLKNGIKRIIHQPMTDA
jgi:GxxExxY protein